MEKTQGLQGVRVEGWEKHGSTPQNTVPDTSKFVGVWSCRPENTRAWLKKLTLVPQTTLRMCAGRGWLWTAGASLAQAKDLYTEERAGWKSQYSRTEPSKSEQTSALHLIFSTLRFDPSRFEPSKQRLGY